jgi:hypothetical protein
MHWDTVIIPICDREPQELSLLHIIEAWSVPTDGPGLVAEGYKQPQQSRKVQAPLQLRRQDSRMGSRPDGLLVFGVNRNQER